MHEGKKMGWNLVKVKSDFKYIYQRWREQTSELCYSISIILFYDCDNKTGNFLTSFISLQLKFSIRDGYLSILEAIRIRR